MRMERKYVLFLFLLSFLSILLIDTITYGKVTNIEARNPFFTGRQTELKYIKKNLNIRSEEHTSELQSLMRISYAVFCLKKKKNKLQYNTKSTHNYNNKT